MSVNIDAVGKRHDTGPFVWTSAQAILYALGVGAGASPDHDELAFTTENTHDTPQRVLPTFAAVLGTLGGADTGSPDGSPVDSPMRDAGEFPLARLLHGEQTVVLHGALPAAGAARSTGYISAIYDKGRHAIIENAAELRDATTGVLLAETVSSVVVRDAGGFGGDPGTTAPWDRPDRPADVVQRYPIRPEQALLYRLSGDRNPLHSDPWFARTAGFERPILHGLCTFGFAGRALLHRLCDGDPDRFGRMSARFAATTRPGDTLDVSIWRTADGAAFRACVGDVAVLDRGTFTLRDL